MLIKPFSDVFNPLCFKERLGINVVEEQHNDFILVGLKFSLSRPTSPPTTMNVLKVLDGGLE